MLQKKIYKIALIAEDKRRKTLNIPNKIEVNVDNF